MFERFTEQARQVVVSAQAEARALKHNYIGTEHLLLGLMREDHSIASRALESLGIAIEDVRARVGQIVGQGDQITTGQIPFTPRAKKILELGLREALSLGHNYIGPEHLLLGLARENGGVAAQILWDSRASAQQVANAVLAELGAGAEAGVFAFSDQAPSDRGVGALPGLVPWREQPPLQLLAGWLLFAVALGVGILIGWAIWGS